MVSSDPGPVLDPVCLDNLDVAAVFSLRLLFVRA
jgi:hypothetical protein